MKRDKELPLNERFVGINGWLAWVLLGLFVSPLLLIANIVSDFSVIDAAKANGFGGAIQFEIISDVGLMSLCLWTAWLILKRKRLAKRIITISLVTSFLVSAVDSAIISGIVGTTSLQNSLNNQASITQGRAALAALIWIPYFYRSRRVRATLTE